MQFYAIPLCLKEHLQCATFHFLLRSIFYTTLHIVLSEHMQFYLISN